MLSEALRGLSLSEARYLLELAAYVMQDGPRGGKFYFNAKGRKVYRQLKGRKKPVDVDVSAPAAKPRRAAQGSDPGLLSGPAVDLEYAGVSPSGRSAMRQVFGDKVPTIERFGEMFSSSKPGGHKFDVRSVSAFGGEVSVEGTIRTAGGDAVGTATRRFRRASPEDPLTVYHAFFEMQAGQQGDGTATAMFESALPHYDKLGVKHVDVTANITAGSYTWARFGFEVKESSASTVQQHYRGAVDRVSTQAGLSKAQQKRVKDIIEKTPFSTIDLAKYRVKTKKRAEIYETADARVGVLEDKIKQEKERYGYSVTERDPELGKLRRLKKEGDRLYEKHPKGGYNFKVGMVLMSETSGFATGSYQWGGRLDLSKGSKTRKQCDAYLKERRGKPKATPAPAPAQ